MKIQTLTTLSVALVISACADGNYKPITVDDHFGEATRTMTRAQIANPDAAQNPAPDSPRHMDGYAGVGIVSGYRQGFSQTAQQSQGITVNIGSGAGK